MIKKTINLYLALAGINRLAVTIPFATYVIFLRSRGLSYIEINLVNVAFFAIITVCEVPTGAIADVFGRKKSFVIACLLNCLGLLVYAYSSSFSQFILAESIIAVGSTFASGAFQAWLVDKLDYQNHDGTLDTVFAKEQQLSSVICIIGAMAGSFLADRNDSWPWLASAGVMFLAAMISEALMKEEYRAHSRVSVKDGWQRMNVTIRSSFRFCISHQAVRTLLWMSLLQLFAVQAPNMQWSLFFRPQVANMTQLGLIASGISIATYVGSKAVKGMVQRTPNKKWALVCTQIIIGVSLLLTGCSSWFPVALTMFMCHEVFRGIYSPIKSAYLNELIPANERATLLSFESMIAHLGGVIGLVASGVAAQYLSIPVAWFLAGLVLAITTLAIGKISKA